MRYIGTSLGRCLRSILLGEVSSSQVFLISTGTWSETKEQYLDIVKQYHQDSYHESDYDLSLWRWEEVEELAVILWNSGKIHQPRNFGASPLFSSWSEVWFEIIPPHLLAEPAAKDLWEKLKVIARLYE
jgi:hypothetical protein